VIAATVSSQEAEDHLRVDGKEVNQLNSSIMYIYVITEVFVFICSGMIMSRGSSGVTAIPELTAYSGSAFLYFYSDAAVNMSGFSIRYR